MSILRTNKIPNPLWVGRITRRRLGAAALVAVLVMVISSSPTLADGGVYGSTKHGDPNTGVYRDTSLPRGNCAQCHNQHGSSTGIYDFGLFAPNYGGNKNGICFTSGCHNGTSSTGYYQGQSYYSLSIHNTSSSCYWPGPNPVARPSSDSGNCANCHNPHGMKDGAGLVPSLNLARDEALCITCHDSSGPALKDIGYQITRTYDHYIDNATYAGRHSTSETMIASNYSGTKRHLECADCHNVHRISSTAGHTTGTNAASDALKGVSRIEASYTLTPWIAPSFTPRDDNYTGDIRYEYELCFKCHSSWAYGASYPTAPSGGVETDQSVEFNPNNKSYHPVVSAIKNNSYTRPTSVNGFKETMLGQWATGGNQHFTMYCSDCHGDDTANAPKGPHGSSSPYILIGSTSNTNNTLCLKCHDSAVYAPSTSPSGETGSRFDSQTTGRSAASHYYHVRSRGIGCRKCHGGRQTASSSPAASVQPGSTHGSNTFVGFMNGTNIASYSPGSCTPTSSGGCHGSITFTAGPE